MASLPLGLIITLCAALLFTVLLIVLYCVCRSKNKNYDHTCVALLHPDVENQLDSYKPGHDIKQNGKKATEVHLSGYRIESAPRDTKLRGQNMAKEKRNSKKELKSEEKEKRGSKKAPKTEKRGSKKKTNNNYAKNPGRESKKEDKPPEKNIEIKNGDKLETKNKRGSKKGLKPYEVKVELRNEEPLESSPVNLFRQSSGQYPEKCPLSVGDPGRKTSLRENKRDSTIPSQGTRPSRDTGNPHYLRPNSMEENTLSAKERREKYSRSRSDREYRHSTDAVDRGNDATLYMRPRSLDAQDGRPINHDHYVRPRSVDRDWDEKWAMERQRSSSYYVTPPTLERDEREKRERDSHYVRPRSFEEREWERRGSERLSSYYLSPRTLEKEEKAKQQRESYYVRPKSFEEDGEKVRRESDKHSSYYMSPRSLDMDEKERNVRESYYVTPRTLEEKEKEKRRRDSYYTRPRSMGEEREERDRSSSYYVTPRSLEMEEKERRDSHYVHPRTLEREEREKREREAHYVIPRSFDNEDSRDHGRDSYYVQPRTLERNTRSEMKQRGDRRYASTQNFRPHTTREGRARRPRSADRIERRGLADTQRSTTHYMTPSTLEMKRDRKDGRRESGDDRYRRDRNASRETGRSRKSERDGEREKREKSKERERGDGQFDTRREERKDGRRSEDRYRTDKRDERKERFLQDIKDERDRGIERKERDKRDRRERSTDRERNGEGERKDKREKSTERERNAERYKKDGRERSSERERNGERSRLERRERSTEREGRERKDGRDQMESGTSRRQGRREERGRKSSEEREKKDFRSWSPKRPLPVDRPPRSRVRSHSLEYIPSSMERKRSQFHAIQRTKSWASRPSQRAESPTVPPRKIQLEFHPLSGDVTPLDTKSEASTEPQSINVTENVELQSSPVLDFEKPAKRPYWDDENKRNWPNLQSDSRRSSATITNSATNGDRKDSFNFQNDSRRSTPTNRFKDEDSKSWQPLQSDSRRSSATVTNSVINDYSEKEHSTDAERKDYRPHFENEGDKTILSGSLVIEYASNTPSKPPLDYVDGNAMSRPKPADFIEKTHVAHSDVFSNSSYDSQSSTDDYRVYQKQVRRLSGRARSTGPKLTDNETFTKPLETRVESESVINLQATASKLRPKRISVSSLSSEDVDWHLYTVDGKKIFRSEASLELKGQTTTKSEVQRSDNGLDWRLFTVSGKKLEEERDIVTNAAFVTQAVPESRKEMKTAGVTQGPTVAQTNGVTQTFTIDETVSQNEIDGHVVTHAPVTRIDSRSKGSVRASLQSHLKNNERSQSRNPTNGKPRRSSSQPIIFSFE